MKITLKQSGGLAPVRRPPVILDTSELEEGRDDVEGLARLVAAQPLRPVSPQPDGMSYTLVITGDVGTREVQGTDGDATPEFASLVQHVRRRGKPAGA